MVSQDFRDGAEMAGKAAGAKLDSVGNKINGLKNEFSGYAKQQTTINEALINKADEHEERMRQLEENRYFVRSSRLGIEDLDPIQQDRLIGWFQKLVEEFNKRGLPVTRNQQKFLSNMLQFLGAMDSIGEVQDLTMLADFGNSELHEIIYKIFLIFTYLYDNSFNAIDTLQDIISLFKLSEQNKNDIQRLLEEQRIPLLGIEGLIGMYDSSRPLNSFTPQTLYANFREIHTHPLLAADVPNDTQLLYIQGLALLAEGKNFSEKQYCYIKSLANVLQCADSLYNIEQLCTNPQKFSVKKWIDALSEENLKYAWLLDGCMLLCQLDGISADTVNLSILEEAAKSLHLLNFTEFFNAGITICLSENAQNLYKAIQQISPKSSGWEHILEYRALGLHGAFDDIEQKLKTLSSDLFNLFRESLSIMTGISFNTLAYSDMSDLADNFIEKMLVKIGKATVSSERAAKYKELEEYQQKAENYIRNNCDALYEGNHILKTFGLHPIPFNNKIRIQEIDNSASNEEWYEDFNKSLDNVTDTLNNYGDAANLICEQLDLIADSKFHISILELKKNEQAEKVRKRKEEIEAKKSIPVSSEDGSYNVFVDWKEIPDTPFPLDDVREIGSAGNNWFIMAGKPYYLDKNLAWHEIPELQISYISDLFQTNGLIFITSYEGTWYSSDCKKWEKMNLPVDERILQIIYFKGKYVLFTAQQRSYQYVEKGLIFDSDKEGVYDSFEVWQSTAPNGKWTKWSEACFSPEGMSLQSNIACSNDIFIAGFSYDIRYKMDKKKSSDGDDVEYFNGIRWKQATWPYDSSATTGGTFFFHKNHGIYLSFLSLLTSKDGYEWQECQLDACFSKTGGICGDAFLTIPSSEGMSVVSLDGYTMNVAALSDAGEGWEQFGFGNGYLLGIFKKTKHKSSLVIGKLNIIKQ